MAKNRPSTIVWCMGQTQHTIGNAIVRASCILQLALGNVGVSGGGTNIFRGHDNVQGATDVGPNPDSLPGYYGLAAGAWKHWAAVWGVDYEWIKKQYASQAMMEKSGMTVSRWIDGVLEKNDLIDQDSNLRAHRVLGPCAEQPDARPGNDRGDEEARPAGHHRSVSVGVGGDGGDGAQGRRLPAAGGTQFETSGSVTASNRSIQWRERVISPLFESQTDHAIMLAFAKKFGFDKEFVKNYKLRQARRQQVRGARTGVDPARDQRGHLDDRLHRPVARAAQAAHEEHGDLRREDAARQGRPVRRRLLRPAVAVLRQRRRSSTPARRTSTTRDVTMMDGGGCFRANFGVERDGVDLLAEDGSHPKGCDLTTGYPEFDHVLLKKLGLVGRAHRRREEGGRGQELEDRPLGRHSSAFMMKHGCHPFGNAKARAIVWNFPDGIPQHREPLYSPRPDMVAKYPTHDDKKAFWRLPTLYKTVQQKNVKDEVAENFPLILTSGRLVEYEGGGEETRSNPWLAELQQENFVEINPKDANDRGIKDGEYVWVKTPTGAQIKVKAMVTERVGPGTTLHPVPLLRLVAGQGHARVLSRRAPRRSCAARRSTPRRPTATTR